MFTESAKLYDLIYSSFKDYEAESAAIAKLIRDAHPHAKSILDVACGSAEHVRLLTGKHGFDVDGLDRDPTFVRIAREKLGDAKVFEGDMTSFSLPRYYVVVQCIFCSIVFVCMLDCDQRTLRR